MKCISIIIALFAGTAHAETWTCMLQPQVIGQSGHGEIISHTFTRLVDDNMAEEFEIDGIKHLEAWYVIRDNDYLIELIIPNAMKEEIEHAVLFKKNKSAVKTLVMGDTGIVVADKGSCEISS
jgi:hypothetical protein